MQVEMALKKQVMDCGANIFRMPATAALLHLHHRALDRNQLCLSMWRC